ncbi:MAG: hypothetical protein MUC41_10025 [Syntrophobacteraceae bacterium]|nr:hypothetical protein [Syntrophobacteraceae bacterium]
MFRQMLIRCPKLGGEVSFAYCEEEGGPLPCARMIQCWSWRIPAVERYLRLKLTEEEWERCFGQAPKEKMAALVELIDSARKRCEPGE